MYSSGIWGNLGAVVAVSRLLQLDTDKFQEAIGITQAHAPMPPSGSFSNVGMTKEGIGWAGMAGCAAAFLAQAGFEGPRDALDHGGRHDPEQLVAGLGEQDYLIMSGYFKSHAACRWAHPAIDGALQLAREHNLGFQDVMAVRVEGYYEMTRLADPYPRTSVAAQFSIPVCVALALRHGRVGPIELSETNIHNARIWDLAHKVEVSIRKTHSVMRNCWRSFSG